MIQKVVSSTTIRCDAKVAWLNDLLGRINAALEIKKESIAQLQSLINGITAQVQVLLAKIKTLKDEQAGLNLQGLKDQLEALKIKLQGLYNDYNTCTNSTKDFQNELNKLQQEKKELEARIDQIKCTIDDLTARKNQLDIDIAALEKKLADLKAER